MRTLFALLFLLSSLVPSNAYAASTFFGVNASTVPPGSPVEIGVFIDSEGEPINAVAGDIVLPVEALNPSISNNGSLISLWLVSPKIENGRVHFEGVIPGGITSSQLPVFSVVLTPSSAGDISITTENVHIYKNDGLGTELPVKNGTLKLVVKEGVTATPERARDTTPPEIFTPIFVNDPNIAGGKTAVAFSAVDNDSGVDYYQVREVNMLFASSWVTATSPYVLRNSFWPNSSVEIRAVDRAGNIRTVSIARPTSIASMMVIGGCILVVVASIILLITLYQRRIWRKQNRSRYRSGT